MSKYRVSAFIDGFNLYHAVADYSEQHLKWIDPWKLCLQFVPSSNFTLSTIYYFSAFATWRPDAYKRHREFIKALKGLKVIPIMGRFKEKDRWCWKCNHRWKDHEEKETDVNIAIHMLRESYNKTFDQLLLISGDSDLAPAIRMIRNECPGIRIKIVIPVARQYSGDLIRAAGGSKYVKKMKKLHVERSLLPREVLDSSGHVVAIRPHKYDPPV